MLKINKNFKDLALIILIGGKSSRFGSDKGLFNFLGKPLISYQLETLYQFNSDIFLVAKSKQQVQTYINKIDIKKIMAFIIDDNNLITDSKFRIPLLGLYSAFKELNKLGYKKGFAISCDIPLIQSNVIKFIVEQSEGYDCCIPKWNNNFLEPLLAIYSIKKSFEKAKQNLIQSNFKLTNLLDKKWSINYLSIENSIKLLDKNLLSFFNINQPKDVNKLMKIYQNVIKKEY